jgi:hypothetical protein
MSRNELIRKAVDMANRVGYALVATSDRNGLVHVAASRLVEAEPDNHVAFSEWFCPGTLANLQENPLPQVERKIRIEVNRVLDFSHAPHSHQEKS